MRNLIIKRATMHKNLYMRAACECGWISSYTHSWAITRLEYVQEDFDAHTCFSKSELTNREWGEMNIGGVR